MICVQITTSVFSALISTLFEADILRYIVVYCRKLWLKFDLNWLETFKLPLSEMGTCKVMSYHIPGELHQGASQQEGIIDLLPIQIREDCG